MLRTVKNLWLMAALTLCAPAAFGFALLGPLGNGGDSWQVPQIGYGYAYTSYNLTPGDPVYLGDIGGPKNLGEGYRRNTPVLYYACDANFLGFFGLQGLDAIDSAFTIMNAAFTNENGVYLPHGVDSYSASLSGFPLEAAHVNYTAQSLYLTDLKSVTLHALVEQMGLAEPERYTWTLAERHLPSGGACPIDEEYLVVQRNYDVVNSPLTALQYSPYVNDTLYSYYIFEHCTPPNPLAVTVPFNVDPYADTFTAVAANNSDGLSIGSFYSGLTRDDVGGLRYLLTTNVTGLATENVTPDSLLVVTNLGPQQLLTTSNFTTLFLTAQTNDPTLLPALIDPNLVVDTVNSTYYFTNVCVPNVISYLTNYNGEAYGTPPHFVVVTNGVNCGIQQIYLTAYDNVITNGNLTNFPGIVLVTPNVHLNYYKNTAAQLVTTSLGTQYGQPYPAPIVTNTTTKLITITNQPSGEYFVLPPSQCGWKITQILSTNTFFNGHPDLATTNVIASATNATGFVDTQSIITYFTNHTFVAYPIICSNIVDVPRLRQGIEKIQFIRADYDSLIGQFWQPVTNDYTMNVLTNGKVQTLRYQRVVTTPDFLMSAADNIAANTFDGTIVRNINFDQTTILNGLAGPGVIDSPTTISYNKVGASFWNSMILFGDTNRFATEFDHIPEVQWASFDASTNPPILYPNGTSIQNLTNLIYTTVSPQPPLLPSGFVNTSYAPVTFSLTSGAFTMSYTWTASGLPAGLTLTSNPDSTATLSGTPTQTGTFDFTVTLTDAVNRSVQWTYTIYISSP